MEKVLPQMKSLLSEKGKMVIVQDVVLSSSLSNHSSSSSLGRSLQNVYSHEQWMNMFRDNDFVVEEARDLGLEYSMPQLVQETSATTRRLEDFFLVFTHHLGVLQFSLQFSEWLFANQTSSTFLRLVQLFQDALQANREREQRA
eukprot:CAMPEP_0116854536 /NCGR_PEP_ID=MMETSP0418-20121206/18674_1 /TAXON_ID=1158023 /ORGANISM="Astrosyne radiata, Strain 13vi08-1A" /LENGTH=143 /DNA_ID=CAMNT_0004487363 /DNA_START=107 /DNA_END=534 /DNA_ORIENTATION=+